MAQSAEAPLDSVSTGILKAICENGRITATEVAEKGGCSKPTALKKMKSLEDALSLQYTIEFDQHKLGLEYRYLIAVKTKNQCDRKRLIQLVKRSDIPQFVAICEGDFNLLIFAAAKSHIEYLRWMSFMRRSLQEGENRILFWKASHVGLERLGFFPLSDGALKGLDLARPQKLILGELNRNSRTPVTELADKLGVSPTAAKYHLDGLQSKGLIRRFTAIVQKPVDGINVACFVDKPFLPDHLSRVNQVRDLYFNKDGDGVVNRYLMVYELSGHSDMFNLANFSSVNEWYSDKTKIAEYLGEGTVIHSAIILDVVFGKLPLRNLDIQKVYDAAQWHFGKEDYNDE